MRRLPFLLLFFSFNFGYADQPEVTAWTNGNVRALRAMFDNNPLVKILGPEESRQRDRASGLLSLTKRDQIFRKCGVFEKINKLMDELDKDMLAMALREYTLQELNEDYPMLSQRELASLKSEVEKTK